MRRFPVLGMLLAKRAAAWARPVDLPKAYAETELRRVSAHASLLLLSQTKIHGQPKILACMVPTGHAPSYTVLEDVRRRP